MTIKSSLKLLLIFSVLTFYTACKSYEITYDKNLEGKTINTGFYVSELPAPNVTYNGGGVAALIKSGLYSEDISKAYSEANLKDIFYEEFLKNGSSISPKIKTSIKNSAEKEIVINQIEASKQKDPKESEFIFEGVPEKLGKDYIFTIKVIDYGMGEGSFSIFSTITYVASIIDMKNNIKIWQMKSEKGSSYPMELALAYSTQKDPVKVKSSLRDCVAGIIQDVSANINSLQKK
jgi:hypothetical protein